MIAIKMMYPKKDFMLQKYLPAMFHIYCIYKYGKPCPDQRYSPYK